jgi:hypothetical protein
MVSRQGADGSPGTEVRAFLQGLKHSRKDAVEAVRETILPAHPGITEQIKWNGSAGGAAADEEEAAGRFIALRGRGGSLRRLHATCPSPLLVGAWWRFDLTCGRGRP